MAAPGQKTMACEDGEGIGNDTRSFAIILISGGNRLIQASQGQWWSIATQGCGAQWAGLIKRQQRAPPDWRGDNSDDVVIAENNAHWRWQDREENQIRLQRNATRTTAATKKGADDHNKEDLSNRGKYAGAARWAERQLGRHRDCRKQYA